MGDDESSSPELRLQRCIRDLAAVQALPSMCIGRTPAEALQIVFDALPTALGADLLYLAVPGAPAVERAWLRGHQLGEEALAPLQGALTAEPGTDGRLSLPGFGELYCFGADVRVDAGRGWLVVGRDEPLDPATDRMLIRSAANLVGTILETATVLEGARRKDEFMAMLGHELRNPLAPIVTAVELLARHPQAAREQQVISRNTRHLSRLVDDLLDISRVTRGHVVLRSEEVPLASVLEQAVELAAPHVGRYHHQLQVDAAPGILLRGDPVRLAQVFGNLLNNAAKFTAPGGCIRVAVTASPGRVRVSVQDNGRGIAREHLGRIFEPFVQIDGRRDAIRGGLGLGLAIVHDLVQRHGGTIAVHSDGPQRGSTFTVELPTVAAEVLASQGPRPLLLPPQSGCRVLIVDDNLDLAELLSEALREEGYDTAAEHDARSALATWRRFRPAAGILDVGLPDLDGYGLAKEVRAEHGPTPVLIAATGYGQPQDRQRAVDSGFDLHLVKPVSVQELVVILQERVVAHAA